MKQSFSTSEVARYCHVTADTIRKWAEAGRITVFKTPGGHRRIRREDLFRFLRQNRIPIHQDLIGPVTSVLIVSKDEALIEDVRNLFDRSHGAFQVYATSDSYETGRQIAAVRPRVVIVDLDAAGEQGPELCGRIAQSPESANATLVAVTRADDGQVGAQAVERGAAAFLRKPVGLDDLRETLASAGMHLDFE